MLNGVVVLSQEETLTTGGFLIISGISIVLFIFCSTFIFKYVINYDWDSTLIGGIVSIGFIFSIVLIYWFAPLPKHTVYKVAIEDKSVSMVDFYNHYNIISTEGSIYTVILKGEN